MQKIGLVLEGGGMRGVYTAGVIDFFIENNIELPYVIGVSAGACHGSGYVSKQFGRGKRTTINYINDKRYLSFKNLIKDKSIFGMNFIFDELPNNLEPYDMDAFNKFSGVFNVVATDCITGEAIYIDCKNTSNVLMAIRASSSLPLVSPIVKYEGKELMDGAVADSIPIARAIKDGCNKIIAVLTRNKDFRMEPLRKTKPFIKIKYRNYPNYIKAITSRYIRYNNTLDLINKLEKENKVLVIRPSKPLKVDRFEKNKSKLEILYNNGYEDAKKIYGKIKAFMDNN